MRWLCMMSGYMRDHPGGGRRLGGIGRGVLKGRDIDTSVWFGSEELSYSKSGRTLSKIWELACNVMKLCKTLLVLSDWAWLPASVNGLHHGEDLHSLHLRKLHVPGIATMEYEAREGLGCAGMHSVLWYRTLLEGDPKLNHYSCARPLRQQSTHQERDTLYRRMHCSSD